MDAALIDAVAKGIERVGIPAGLILAGMFLLHKLATSIGPSIAKFFETLSERLVTHSVEHKVLEGKIETGHAQLEGKLDVHHERTVAELRRTQTVVKASVDSVRAEVLKAIDKSTDRIVDKVAPPAIVREASTTPVSGIPRTARLVVDDDDTQPSEKDR
ncbi:MAG: hypothetical protein U0441_14950 [Polyangiaceae bacterium]